MPGFEVLLDGVTRALPSCCTAQPIAIVSVGLFQFLLTFLPPHPHPHPLLLFLCNSCNSSMFGRACGGMPRPPYQPRRLGAGVAPRAHALRRHRVRPISFTAATDDLTTLTPLAAVGLA